MSNLIANLEPLLPRYRYDFHSFFRNRCLSFRESFLNGSLDFRYATSIPQELICDTPFCLFLQQNLVDVKKNFLNILLSPQSDQILWHLYCTPATGFHSALAHLCPSLGSISQVVRGGPNVYKLSGWLVHVLVAYEMVVHYIHSGLLPATLAWPHEVEKFFTSILSPLYNSLSELDRAILHVALLGHDIGVVVKVTDHDIHGVPLIPTYLDEISITENSMCIRFNGLEFEDFVWAVQSLVRYHTFINRAGVEFSNERSSSEVCKLQISCKSSLWRQNFLNRKFAQMILLIGVGDLVAVDDSLLTTRKTIEIGKGYKLVSDLCEGLPIHRDPIRDGYLRFLVFLSDTISSSCTFSDANDLIISAGYNPDVFWRKFYNVSEFNFTLSLMPFLPSLATIVEVFVLTFSFIDCTLGDDPDIFRKITIFFNPKLEVSSLLLGIAEVSEIVDVNERRKWLKQNNWQLPGLAFSWVQDNYNSLIAINPI